MDDNRGGGATLKPCQHHAELWFIAADQRFNTAIGAVTNPACNAEPVRFLLGVVTEADALDPAFNANPVCFQQNLRADPVRGPYPPLWRKSWDNRLSSAGHAIHAGSVLIGW